MTDLLAELLKVAGIFALSFFSFWPSIPAGLLLGLSPVVVVVTTTLSYMAGVVLILIPGDRIRTWISRRYGDKSASYADSPIWRIWQRYGVIGLGLLGPMTVGAQIGTLVGVSLNALPRRLFVWMSIGALLWAIVLTLGTVLGVLGVQSLT